MDDGYFLSAENPVANIDQRELEARALALWARPEIQKARNAVAHLWREAMAYPCREQMDEFDGMIDELVFWNVLFAANGDGGYPRVLRVMEPPLRSFGRELPGSRWGGDCADFNYRMIPIAHGGRYEIEITPAGSAVVMSNYALMGAAMSPPANLSVLDSRDTETGAGGVTVLTLDETPASGRKNHIQTRPGAHHLLVRDAVTDWLHGTPNKIRVRRVDGAGQAPRGDEDLAAEAVRRIMETCFYAFYITRSSHGLPPNVLSTPGSSGPSGGMPSQWTCKGAVVLEADEAMIVTVNKAGALYRNVQLDDIFHRSLPFWDRTGSFNATQMAQDEDGRSTYVIAHEDPGIHNWLDTGERRHTLFGHRWQHFVKSAQEPVTVSSKIVKFTGISAALPAGVRTITAQERERQLKERYAGYQRRLHGR